MSHVAEACKNIVTEIVTSNRFRHRDWATFNILVSLICYNGSVRVLDIVPRGIKIFAIAETRFGAVTWIAKDIGIFAFIQTGHRNAKEVDASFQTFNFLTKSAATPPPTNCEGVINYR